MKEYEVRHNIGDDIYALLNKKIMKSKIYSLRITEQRPAYKRTKESNYESKHHNGVTIEYLLLVEETDNHLGFDWFDQEDVYLSKEEVIRKII